MNGKGSKQRPTNKMVFDANYSQINWTKSKSFIGRPVSDFEDYPYVILSEDGVNFGFDKNAPWNCLGFHVKNGVVESVEYK